MARVLLIDDDEANRLTLGALLDDAGHDVIEADALASARAALGDGSRFDLVVTDVNLEDGLGTDLLPMIRETQPGAGVLVISGGTQSQPPALADAFVSKGTSPSELLAKIHKLLRPSS